MHAVYWRENVKGDYSEDGGVAGRITLQCFLNK